MATRAHNWKGDSDPAFPKLIAKIGNDLRDLRLGQGHSAENVARMMGQTSGTAISQVERGERSGMTVYILFKIARALGYDMEIRFVRKGRSKKEKASDDATESESGSDVPGGDSDRNVVQLRSVRSHPSGHQGHRSAH